MRSNLVEEPVGPGEELCVGELLPIGSDLRVGYWLERRGERIAVVGEWSESAWLIELSRDAEVEATGPVGYALVVGKEDGRVLRAFACGDRDEEPVRIPTAIGGYSGAPLESPDQPIGSFRGPGGRGLGSGAGLARAGSMDLVVPLLRGLVCVREAPRRRVPVVTPAGTLAGSRVERRFVPLSVLSSHEADQSRAEAGIAIVTSVAHELSAASVGELRALRVRITREYTVGVSGRPSLGRIVCRRDLASLPRRSSTRVGDRWIDGWELDFERLQRVYDEDDRLVAERSGVGLDEAMWGPGRRGDVTVFVTDDPIVRALSPAALTAPHLGVVWDTSCVADVNGRIDSGHEEFPMRPFLLGVTDSGVKARPRLPWPPRYRSSLVH